MASLFGIPMDTLMVVLLAAFAVVSGLVAILALRNRILLTLGLRNLRRRPGRTALIVLGLMLATAIVSAALGTGDTMTHTIRSTALTALGHTDEVISLPSAESGTFGAAPLASEASYFDEALFAQVRDAVANSELADGIAPAIAEVVAVQDVTSRQIEPRIALFASDPAYMEGFGEIRQAGGGTVSLADLMTGEVYLDDDAARELDAGPGDELLVFAGGRAVSFNVRAIVEYQGNLVGLAGMLMPLDAAQELLGRQGQIEHIMISNRGGALAGVEHTEAVIDLLEPTLESLGLEINASKQEALDIADLAGNAFASFFVTFGTFSILAGILLIFLIFVMLAAERRSEMGMARAVGTKRRQLVQMFVFEGMAYDLAAAAVGALVGLAVAYGMVFIMARSFAFFEVEIEHDFRPRSLIIAYTLGVLLTFAVVAASAWRVSALNIVTAIRNLPDMMQQRAGRATRVLAVVGILLGAVLTISGLTAAAVTPFNLGISFVIISLVPLLRTMGLSDRLAYTIPGIALVVWWLLPAEVSEAMLPDASSDISIFIVAGVMIVIGATWVVMYNSDLLLNGVVAAFGRIGELRPVIKTAVAYPLTNRFRTGVTLAMFTLIVFTLVVGAAMTTSFTNALNNEEAYSGGFDIRATTTTASPVDDMRAAIAAAEGLDVADFVVLASRSVLLLEAQQVDAAGADAEPYPVRGLDDAFLASNTYEFALIAEGYGSSQEVWQALAENPGLAVVDPLVVPRRGSFVTFGTMPSFQLEGFYLEDETFSPVSVTVQDPATNAEVRLTIIGVLKETAPAFMIGIATSQRTLAQPFADRTQPTEFFFKLRDGADVEATVAALESAFLPNGMEATVLKDEMEEAIATSQTFNRLLQGFMGLGLVVGVAALAVISARSVVERRQQIGVLRAIGFKRRMVQLSFLVESSFIAVTSIVLGTALALVTSFNVIRSVAQQGSWEDLGLSVPWLNLVIIFAVVLAATLLTTFLPARQASRVYPAEALRYE